MGVKYEKKMVTANLKSTMYQCTQVENQQVLIILISKEKKYRNSLIFLITSTCWSIFLPL